jgi:peptidoglycan/xylan/chitin deacetylase (PgdA/CDA1 family)
MYHWFRSSRPGPRSRSPQLEIAPELFERQMALLQRAGYRTVSLAQAASGEASAGRGRPVVITFDDGTLDFWEHGRNVLERHGFTATLFVVTGAVGGQSGWDRHLGEPSRSLLSWAQLRELHCAGFEIGSHTHSHRPFTEIDDDDVRHELARSRQALQDELGLVARFVAYPRGFYLTRHKRLAREAGYEGACAVILRWSDLRRSDRYELKRMTIKGTESMLGFRMRLRLCGLTAYSPA